ncbi:MAG: hypothetical protein K6A23_04425 [Butyrivibrio sp.]|nr:hypothetical protein [Butyrivibrio sp.]
MDSEKIQEISMLLAAIFLSAYAVCLSLGQVLVSDIFSPLCCLMVFICIIVVGNLYKSYKYSIYCFAFGAFTWMMGDIFFFIDTHNIYSNEVMSHVSDGFYKITSFMYIAGLLINIWIDYTRSDIWKLIVKTVVFTNIIYIFSSTWFEQSLQVTIDYSAFKFNNLVGLLIAMSVITLSLIIIVDRGKKHISFFSICLFLGLFLYGILDIRYSFVEVAGIDPEANVADISFLISIVLLGLAFTSRSIGIFYDNTIGRVRHEAGRMSLLVVIGFLLIGIVAFLVGFMSLKKIIILTFVSVIYIILWYIIHQIDKKEKEKMP